MLLITLIQFALPILLGKAAVSTDITLKLKDDYSPKQFGFNFSMSGVSHYNSHSTNSQRNFSEMVLFERRLCGSHLLEWKNAIDVHFEWACLDQLI